LLFGVIPGLTLD